CAVLVGRQSDHPRFGRDPLDAARRLRTATPGHAHVEERDVRLLPLGGRDRFVCVTDRGRELEPRLVVDERSERASYRLVVFGDKYPNRLPCAHGCTGSVAARVTSAGSSTGPRAGIQTST